MLMAPNGAADAGATLLATPRPSADVATTVAQGCVEHNNVHAAEQVLQSVHMAPDDLDGLLSTVTACADQGELGGAVDASYSMLCLPASALTDDDLERMNAALLRVAQLLASVGANARSRSDEGCESDARNGAHSVRSSLALSCARFVVPRCWPELLGAGNTCDCCVDMSFLAHVTQSDSCPRRRLLLPQLPQTTVLAAPRRASTEV